MEWKWNTTSAWSPELHDGNHDLCLEWKSFDGSVLASAFSNVDLKNLTIPSVKNVENIEGGVIVWKDELQGSTVPLTVTVERYDITQPVDLTLTIYDTAMDPHIDSPIRTITATGVTLTSTSPTTGTYTFQWDGKKSDGVTFANPGTYTYDVRVSATDVYDIATYRSKYLKVHRALDDLGEPIYDVEYQGYDENETPEIEEDDSYIYIIRRYILEDSLNINASEGWIWLYNPCLEKVAEWDIETLECVEDNHSGGDGLDASTEGIQHSVKVNVPVSLIQDPGIYRFVIHAKDYHVIDYRSHERRWAVNLNSGLTFQANIVLEVSPNYLPEIGNQTNVEVKIMDSEQKRVLTGSKVPVTITITPSHLSGISTNYPVVSPDTLADFVLQSIDCANGQLTMQPDRTAYNPSFTKTIYSVLDPNRPSGEPMYANGVFNLNLTSYDYGGRVKIVASRPNDGKWNHVGVVYQAHPDAPKMSQYIWVPWDYDEDRIPDVWEYQHTGGIPQNYYNSIQLGVMGYNTDVDNDPVTPNSNIGDGYWAFFEYRGIHHKGIWTRLDPNKKELFFYRVEGLGSSNLQQLLSTATGLTVYEVNNDEMMSSNMMTRNAYVSPDYETGGAMHLQNGIRIIKDDTNKGYLGIAGWCTPNDVVGEEHCVRIYHKRITEFAKAHNLDELTLYNHVIIHEIGHNLKLTPAGVVDDEGKNHHYPNTNTCAMDKAVVLDNYDILNYCQNCKDSIFLH